MKILPSISVIVPTYKERDNLEELFRRLDSIRVQFESFEVLIMDDNSGDGSEEVVAQLGQNWFKIVVRKANRGLSPAVIDGMKLAQNEILVTMDADLSHPPEKIPEMVRKLTNENFDFIVGSRYVKGGKVDQDWSLFRHLNSRVSTLMARPFTRIKDPMSGFFALRRSTFLAADTLSPLGYKIGLELIVKCHCRRVGEVPIEFLDRVRGQSKLSMKEQMKFLIHLSRLARYRMGQLFCSKKRVTI